MLHFLILTKRKFLYFILIILGWNLLQSWVVESCWHSDCGNAPSYISLSLAVLEQCFGRSSVYPPGQSWISFPNAWVVMVILIFWVAVWYMLACLIDAWQKSLCKKLCKVKKEDKYDLG